MGPPISSGKAYVFKRGRHDHSCKCGKSTKVVTGPPACHGKGDGLNLSLGDYFSAMNGIGTIPPFETWTSSRPSDPSDDRKEPDVGNIQERKACQAGSELSRGLGRRWSFRVIKQAEDKR